MTEDTQPKAPNPRKTATANKKTAAKPKKIVAKTANAKELTPVTNIATDTTTTENRSEAKTRFNAALEEAKAGAAALKAEGKERVVAYRDTAKGKGETYAADAKVKGRELADTGKVKTSEGLRALSGAVAENAHIVDEKLGAKYGDYARTASRSLDEYAGKLDQKSVEELGEDARQFVRKSPGTAIGIAAVFGFMLSRLFGGSRR